MQFEAFMGMLKEVLHWIWLLGAFGLAVYLFSYLVKIGSICVHRLWFHPLARHPGPLLARVSNVYAGYHAWRGDAHRDILRCHEIYGSVVRYGPDRLLFNSAQAMSDIYSHRSKVLKSKAYHRLSRHAPNSLTLQDKTLHGRRRRVMSHAFSDTALRSFEPRIVDKIRQLRTALLQMQEEADKASVQPERWGATKDMGRFFDYLTFDIMTDVTFSAHFNTILDATYRYAIEAIARSNVRLGTVVVAPELGWKKIQPYIFPRELLARYHFVMFIRKVLSDRLGASEEERGDIMSIVQRVKDPDTGKGLDEAELSAETAVLIVAGTDTTSTVLAATLHYLSRSPQHYRRAAEEVRSKFNTMDEVRMGPTLNSCTYLRACIDEALRMSPPAGGALLREVVDGGITVDGTYVPEGYDVGVGIHSIHHHPVYYPQPYRYDPSRWLQSDAAPADGANDANRAYAPFGAGPRSCVGRPLAILELMLTLASLLVEFDFRASGRDERAWDDGTMVAEQFHLTDHVTGQKNGPLIDFRWRKRG